MEKDCIRLTSEEKERLIEFKKSDKFLKAYKLIKEEIGLKERKKAVYFSISESLSVPGAIYTENAGCMVSRKSSTQP